MAGVIAGLVVGAGCGALLVSAFGDPIGWARDAALFGALMFTGIWGMFTVVGNHFSYWFCHDGAQNTHFQLVIWGAVTLVFQAM